jgi:hypothetical protein
MHFHIPHAFCCQAPLKKHPGAIIYAMKCMIATSKKQESSLHALLGYTLSPYNQGTIQQISLTLPATQEAQIKSQAITKNNNICRENMVPIAPQGHYRIKVFIQVGSHPRPGATKYECALGACRAPGFATPSHRIIPGTVHRLHIS